MASYKVQFFLKSRINPVFAWLYIVAYDFCTWSLIFNEFAEKIYAANGANPKITKNITILYP